MVDFYSEKNCILKWLLSHMTKESHHHKQRKTLSFGLNEPQHAEEPWKALISVSLRLIDMTNARFSASIHYNFTLLWNIKHNQMAWSSQTWNYWMFRHTLQAGILMINHQSHKEFHCLKKKYWLMNACFAQYNYN